MVLPKIPQFINEWGGVVNWLRGKNSATEILALSDGEHVEIKCTAPSDYPFGSGSISSPDRAFCVVPAEQVPSRIREKLKHGQDVDITKDVKAELITDWDGFLNLLRGRHNSAQIILALIDKERVEIKFRHVLFRSYVPPANLFCVVSAEEVPPKIREKLKHGQDVNITKDVEAELDMPTE